MKIKMLMKYLEKKITIPDPIETYKTIKDIKEGNRDEDIMGF